MNTYTIKCCEAMHEELDADNLICILDTEPFSTVKTAPTAYVQSDGGFGGFRAIAFCPFCGKAIQIEAVEGGKERV